MVNQSEASDQATNVVNIIQHLSIYIYIYYHHLFTFFLLRCILLAAIIMCRRTALSRRCSKLAPRLDEVKELTRDQAVRHGGFFRLILGGPGPTHPPIWKCQVYHLIFDAAVDDSSDSRFLFKNLPILIDRCLSGGL